MTYLKTLEQRLGYSFRKPELLELALTHRSFHGHHNNERLEFLGDSILGWLIASELFERFPDLDEGSLSRLRAHLVCGKQLAEIGKALELSEHLIVGAGEGKSGGHHRNSIIADAVEAVLGAIFLDSREHGVDDAKRCVLSWFEESLASLTPAAARKDAKTRLQEWMQSRGLEVPTYEVVSIVGPDHSQCFTVECRLNFKSNTEVFEGQGRGRRKAEQQAASAALASLNH